MSVSPHRGIPRLAVLRYAAAIASLIYFIVGWCCVDLSFVGEVLFGTNSVVIADSRGYTRILQSPVLLTYLFGVVFVFAVVVGTGLLTRRPWARRWALCTPVMALPLLVPVVWLIARYIVLDRYGYTSTDPAFSGHVTPIADFWRAVVMVLVVWAAATVGYWFILRKNVVAEASVAAGRVRLGGRYAYPAAFGVVLGLFLALINFKMSDGRMLIHDASDYGWTKAVGLLLCAGQDVNARTKHGSTPLHYATHSGRIGTVKYLLDHGADINAHDGYGRTPVVVAALGVYSLWGRPNRDCYSTLLCLLDRGAEVKTTGSSIMEGVIEGVAELPGYPRPLVHQLLKRGFPVNASYLDQTLLSLAAEQGQPQDIDYLLAHGARMYPYLAGLADLNNLAHLLKRGFDVHAADRDGKTALHHALQRDTVGSPGDGKAIVRLLVRHGADIHAKDKDGNTPVGLADTDLRRILVGTAAL